MLALIPALGPDRAETRSAQTQGRCRPKAARRELKGIQPGPSRGCFNPAARSPLRLREPNPCAEPKSLGERAFFISMIHQGGGAQLGQIDDTTIRIRGPVDPQARGKVTIGTPGKMAGITYGGEDTIESIAHRLARSCRNVGMVVALRGTKEEVVLSFKDHVAIHANISEQLQNRGLGPEISDPGPLENTTKLLIRDNLAANGERLDAHVVAEDGTFIVRQEVGGGAGPVAGPFWYGPHKLEDGLSAEKRSALRALSKTHSWDPLVDALPEELTYYRVPLWQEGHVDAMSYSAALVLPEEGAHPDEAAQVYLIREGGIGRVRQISGPIELD